MTVCLANVNIKPLRFSAVGAFFMTGGISLYSALKAVILEGVSFYRDCNGMTAVLSDGGVV